MSAELTIAAVQMTSVDDVEINVAQMEQLVHEVFKSHQPRLVCFPENCLYFRITEGESISGLTLSHIAFQRLAALATRYNTYLHLGSVPLYIEGHLYNSSVVVAPDGSFQPTYQKMHLFDIQLEGQNPIRESDVFRHGQGPSSFIVDDWKIAETICYDLRFAELYARYARHDMDVILVPAAFLVKTGEAHWEILLRARAIESQAYVVASAQGGTHAGVKSGSRETFGHTLMVDPWGAVVGQVEKRSPGFTVTKLTRDRVDTVRKQIPMKFHRRLPVA